MAALIEIRGWISRDPLEDAELKEGPNLYDYCSNNPIFATDLFGLCEEVDTGVEVWKDTIPNPHMWFKIPKDGFSIGFYPEGNILWGPGIIESPDPHQGGQKSFDVKLDKCKYDAAKFRSYIESEKGASAPNYSVIFYTCANWVADIIGEAMDAAEKK